MEVKILQESLPVIEINFDEMKATLKETLENYKGIIVTEETLPACKSTQRELAGVRNKIDTYRKEKKKVLSKPIVDFENQCKELISLIEQAEAPIKEGIKVFDDEKREMKRQQAIELSKEVIEEIGLNEKYADRLEILDKYCNLTAKSNEVREDLISRALTLKVEQDRENELMEIIKDTVDSENERINRKIKFEDFKRYIDRGMTAKEVIAEIKLTANRIYEAENPPPMPEPEPISELIQEPEPTPEPIAEPEIKPLAPETIDEPTYYAVYRIVGNIEELRNVSKFLKDNGIQYTVTDQGEL